MYRGVALTMMLLVDDSGETKIVRTSRSARSNKLTCWFCWLKPCVVKVCAKVRWPWKRFVSATLTSAALAFRNQITSVVR